MSRFFSSKLQGLIPYVPGEQPRDRKYIKLNTNESPFPPSQTAIKLASEAAEGLQLYSDPTAKALHDRLAARYGVSPDEIITANGSDEVLNFAFMAFCDAEHPAVFPDITYGFYKVFADVNGVPYEEIPLCDDLQIDPADYIGIRKNIFLANPNAPTGIALPLSDIERIVASNPDNVVVIDEAYIDFGGESAVSLIKRYNNLLVTQTFSKSRSMAGARLGFGIADSELIRDLNTVRFSTNPYNVNAMTQAAGIGMLLCEDEVAANCNTVIKNRAWLASELTSLGFSMPPSSANFLFVKHPAIKGKILYQKLREHGILVRHFEAPRICEYNRITVGRMEEMKALVDAVRAILEETL